MVVVDLLVEVVCVGLAAGFWVLADELPPLVVVPPSEGPLDVAEPDDALSPAAGAAVVVADPVVPADVEVSPAAGVAVVVVVVDSVEPDVVVVVVVVVVVDPDDAALEVEPVGAMSIADCATVVVVVVVVVTSGAGADGGGTNGGGMEICVVVCTIWLTIIGGGGGAVTTGVLIEPMPMPV